MYLSNVKTKVQVESKYITMKKALKTNGEEAESSELHSTIRNITSRQF